MGELFVKSGRFKWTLIAITLASGLAFSIFWSPADLRYQVGPDAGPGKITPQISVASEAALFLAPNGTLWAWGAMHPMLGGVPGAIEFPHQIGTNSDWGQIACPSYHATLALKTNGTLWGWGGDGYGRIDHGSQNQLESPTQIGKDNDWTTIAAGFTHVLALKRDGTIWSCGQNNYGQLGNGSTNKVDTPVPMNSQSRWKAISAGGFSSYALDEHGRLWVWGLSGLGTSSTKTHSNLSPTPLDDSTNWVSIGSGEFYMIAL